MTVAAVVLAATAESAVAEVAGRPAVRRITESAWAGGAVPIVVVSVDREGAVAAALTGSEAVLAEPAPEAGGPVAQMSRGIAVARQTVAGTDAALLWPAGMVWVDAETVTSLIQAHGLDPDALLRPAWRGEPGWPVLIPLTLHDALEALGPSHLPNELLAELESAGIPLRVLDLGDPGVTHGRDTTLESLPVYEGPSQPVGGHPPEWGASAADHSDDSPLAGPALAPYEPA
ncbi:MAG: NTP transferase domain-containing protein [Chloroflexi bacterium]|jgi:CTP:molybdopterin cytidylyltransferase MocA|nr:NTP transferase domain-containing protein [Chloroflexota bacterium]